jgi:hypothetical protein
MKYLLGFALFCFLFVGAVKVLGWFGVDAPPKPIQLRANFTDAALPVVGLFERAHDHQLNLGKDELPQDAINRLRTYAHGFDENFIVDNINGLYIIVEANAENEYYGCDAEINQVLRSRVMPNVPFPSCK